MVKDGLVPVVNHPDSGQRHRLQAGRTHWEGNSHVPVPQLIWESLLPSVTTASHPCWVACREGSPLPPPCLHATTDMSHYFHTLSGTAGSHSQPGLSSELQPYLPASPASYIQEKSQTTWGHSTLTSDPSQLLQLSPHFSEQQFQPLSC